MTLTGQGASAADGSSDQPMSAAPSGAIGFAAAGSGLHHPALQPLDIPVSPAGHLPPHLFSPLTNSQVSAGAHLLSLISPKGAGQTSEAPAQPAQQTMQQAMPAIAAIWNQSASTGQASQAPFSAAPLPHELQQQYSQSMAPGADLDLPRLPSNPWCLPSPDSLETIRGKLSMFASSRQAQNNAGYGAESFAGGPGGSSLGVSSGQPQGYEAHGAGGPMGGLGAGVGSFLGSHDAGQQLPGSWQHDVQHGGHQNHYQQHRPPAQPSSQHEQLSWQQQQLLQQQQQSHPEHHAHGHGHDMHRRLPQPPQHNPPHTQGTQQHGQAQLNWQQQQQQWQAWQQQGQATGPPPGLTWQQLGASLGGLSQGASPLTGDPLAAALGALPRTGDAAALQHAELLMRMARGQGSSPMPVPGQKPPRLPPPPPPPPGMQGAIAALQQQQQQSLHQAILTLQLQQLQLQAEQQAGALLAAQGGTPPRHTSFGSPTHNNLSPMRGSMGMGMPHVGSPGGLHDQGLRDGRRGQQGMGRQRSPMPRRLSASSGPPPCRASLPALDEMLVRLASRLAPSPEERQRHQDTLDRVRAALATEWPEARVHLFGSAANDLCIGGANDIDVTLELPGADDNEAKSAIVQRLGELFTAAGMLDVQAIPRARVPVCKARDPATSTRFDVTVNNVLALVNTKLLRDYAALDPRLRQLVFLVKQWAKLRGVNDSYRGTLSSYAYVLLCIHLLQRRSPPILPVLQCIGAQQAPPPPPPPPPGHHSSGSSTVGGDEVAAASAAASAAVAAAAASAASAAANAATVAAAASAVLSGVGSEAGGSAVPAGTSSAGGSDKDAPISVPGAALPPLPPQPPPQHPSSARHSLDGQQAHVTAPPPPPPPHHRRGPSGDAPAPVLASLGLPPPPPPPPGRRRSSHQGDASQDPAAGLPRPAASAPQQPLHMFSQQVGPWHCEFCDDVAALKSFGAANQETLAELLVAFFDYWAWRHDYNSSVVSIRVPGGIISKASKNWTMRQGSERHLVCIEDPFELSHDLGRTIDKISVVGLRREFERAARLFANEEDPLSMLFTPA